MLPSMEDTSNQEGSNGFERNSAEIFTIDKQSYTNSPIIDAEFWSRQIWAKVGPTMNGSLGR